MSYYKQDEFENYFWNRFDKTDSCWLWKGRLKQPHNYGTVQKDHKTIYIHRMAYTLTFGEIPDNLVVRHNCHVRHCGNPAHLEVGTQAENIQDSVKDARFPKGENHYSAKLNKNIVIEVRKRYWKNNESCSNLAKELEINEGTLRNAINGKTWKHLQNYKQTRKRYKNNRLIK